MQRRPQEWMPEGNCFGRALVKPRKTDRELFPGRGYTQKFVPMCVGCPVKQECYNYGLVHDEDGVWGGTYYNQRWRLYGTIAHQRLINQAAEEGWLEVDRVNFVLVPERSLSEIMLALSLLEIEIDELLLY